LQACTDSFGGRLGNLSIHDAGVAGDFLLKALCRVDPGTGWDDFSVVFNYQDTINYYHASFNEQNDEGTHGIFKIQGAIRTQIADFSSMQISAGSSFEIEIERSGSQIIVRLNGQVAGQASDATFTGGKVGFGSVNNPSRFDDLTVSE